ncbi:MAG: hypothetical protein AAGF23_22710, partial [Acidobacteriota bacterium]
GLPPGIDPETSLGLRLVSAAGETVAEATFFPAAVGDPVDVLLDGRFTDLPKRGWQHRLELAAGDGVLDTSHVRFGLDCTAEPCRIVADNRTLIDGAVGVDAKLAPFLESSEPLDLAALAAARPDLAESVYEAGVDLNSLEEAESCTCFFTADVNGAGQPRSVISARWEEVSKKNWQLLLYYRWHILGQTATSLDVGHETWKDIDMDFLCFKLTPGGAQPVTTTAGVLLFTPPELEACPAPCAPTVNWSTAPYWGVYIDNHIEVTATASYDVAWTVDGAQLYQDDQSWTATGVQYQPLQYSGNPASPPGVSAQQMPTSSRFGGSSAASVADVADVDRPQVEVAAGAVMRGTGKAACAAERATVESHTTELPPGMTPSTLVVVLGDDIDP